MKLYYLFPQGGGGGGTLIFSIYIGWADFLGVNFLNFNIFFFFFFLEGGGGGVRYK